MTIIQKKIYTVLLCGLIFSQLVFAQDKMPNTLNYDVYRVYPPISITKKTAQEAVRLIDLDSTYKADWVRTYSSVEVSTMHNGSLTTAVATSEILSQEQKKSIRTADTGSDIFVKIRYTPENTLKQNGIKELSFSVHVEPENDAYYIDGQQALKKYLKESATDKIAADSFKGYALAAVKFSINEKGEIVDAKVFESSKDAKIDTILLDAIRKMPNWVPAEYADGTKIKQEFVLTVGNMDNCIVHLLNIRR